ncbi:MAG: hypothetical protein ACFFB3_17910, partial [Candidatus Hodarchaeota archaeon]
MIGMNLDAEDEVDKRKIFLGIYRLLFEANGQRYRDVILLPSVMHVGQCQGQRNRIGKTMVLGIDRIRKLCRVSPPLIEN